MSAAALTLAAVGQVVLAFVLYEDDANEPVRIGGWILLWLSAAFGWLPIFTLKRRGGVRRGESYTRTTVLVDRGLYAIVRHPQYLAGILLGVALSLIVQHWLVTLLGAVVVTASYADTFDEERALREKFGPSYDTYRERVPRVNLVTGIVRWARRRSEGPA